MWLFSLTLSYQLHVSNTNFKTKGRAGEISVELRQTKIIGRNSKKTINLNVERKA